MAILPITITNFTKHDKRKRISKIRGSSKVLGFILRGTRMSYKM